MVKNSFYTFLRAFAPVNFVSFFIEFESNEYNISKTE